MIYTELARKIKFLLANDDFLNTLADKMLDLIWIQPVVHSNCIAKNENVIFFSKKRDHKNMQNYTACK